MLREMKLRFNAVGQGLRGLKRTCALRGSRGNRFLLGLVIPVSDSVHNYMTKLQIDLMRQFGIVGGLECAPHITLKQAFPTHTLRVFEHYLDTISKEIDPFRIQLRGFDAFDGNLIFLNVVPNLHLSALRERIVSDLRKDFGVEPYALEDERYRFHATLVHSLSKSRFHRARAALAHETIDFSFSCNSLELVCHTGQGWITYRRSTLARAATNLEPRLAP